MPRTQSISHGFSAPTWLLLSVLTTWTTVTAETTAAHAGGIDAIGTLSFVDLRSPDSTGKLQPYAEGAGVALSFIELDSEVTLAGEARAFFLGGADDRRVYDLGLSFLVSYRLEREDLVIPFMRLGLDLTGISAPDVDESRHRSVMAGVHGGAGLHGFLGKKLYWRAEMGFLGAGPGGVTGQVGLGYTFGKL